MKNKQRKNKSSDGKYIVLIFLAVIALFAMSCGFFYANSRSQKDVGDSDNAKVSEEINLLDESIEAQRLVDNILLQKNNWQLIENEHGQKDVIVEESGAKVKINQRELAVGIPNTTSLTGVGEWLQEKIHGSDLVYISGEMTKYKNWDAFKAQIGIKVKAGGGNKNFLTDTVIFFHNSNLKKKDKDVKDLPEKDLNSDKDKVSARQYKGKLAIIVDDCGYDTSSVKTMLATGLPFSYAILPNKPYSTDVLSMVKSKGAIPMLHLPMEPMNRSAMSEGKNTICVDFSAEQKRELVRKSISGLPGLQGVNNHQGSRVTSDSASMQIILQELKRQGLFFVDSRTTSASVARSTAQKVGVLTAQNDIFLDNSSDVEAIREQIYKAMALADKNGSAIAICHARVNTATCWNKYASEFKRSGITFVPVTELLY